VRHAGGKTAGSRQFFRSAQRFFSKFLIVYVCRASQPSFNASGLIADGDSAREKTAVGTVVTQQPVLVFVRFSACEAVLPSHSGQLPVIGMNCVEGLRVQPFSRLADIIKQALIAVNVFAVTVPDPDKLWQAFRQNTKTLLAFTQRGLRLLLRG
jgi:hypothetical protein